MIFSLYTNYGALNSQPVFSAFATGALQLGHKVVYNSPDADVAVIWSVLWNGRMAKNKDVWKHFTAAGKPVIVLEVGALRRNSLWKVGLNGINRQAYFAPKGNNSNRANSLRLQLRDWEDNPNGPIMICTQHHLSQQWENLPPINQYLENTISEIRQHTGRLIIIRPHPRSPITGFTTNHKFVEIQQPRKLPNTYDDFDFDVRRCWAVINWSSNPAVQAVMDGVPVFVGPNSLAYDVGNHSLDTLLNPIRPDRRQWLNDLAHVEYSLDEISKGIPLKHLTERL